MVNELDILVIKQSHHTKIPNEHRVSERVTMQVD